MPRAMWAGIAAMSAILPFMEDMPYRVDVYKRQEHIYGYDYVTSCYKDNPQDSWKQIVYYMHEMYREATDKQIRKVLK